MQKKCLYDSQIRICLRTGFLHFTFFLLHLTVFQINEEGRRRVTLFAALFVCLFPIPKYLFQIWAVTAVPFFSPTFLLTIVLLTQPGSNRQREEGREFGPWKEV